MNASRTAASPRLRARRLATLLPVALVATLLGMPPAAADVMTVTLTGPTAMTVGSPGAFSGMVSQFGVGLPAQEVQVLVDEVPATSLTTGSDGRYATSVTFTTRGTHRVQTRVHQGGVLQSSSPVWSVMVSPAGVDQTEPTDLFASSAFLYTGTSPAQSGVAPGTITEPKVAVLHGSVRDRAGQGLDGVTVSVADRPEYGQTLTRDGTFDLVVNGDAPLVLRYRKPGLLPLERVVTPDARDYTVAPDVVMVALDGAANPVNLGWARSQTARGSAVSDGDGARRATLYFPPNVHATMRFAAGGSQALSGMTVRATEYTVGDSGPQAMPGTLPFASGYTYAVELSVDEAIAAGASTVTFDKPVVQYVENFLGFPVGTPVPAGYYDFAEHAWLPQPDGRVIAITAEAAGAAAVDTDGDGAADSAATLSALGISAAERQQLAVLYEPGQQLWRASTSHFTPRDLNFPYGYGPGADNPAMGQQPRTDGQCTQSGSVIGCENQSLGEVVPIAGTPVALVYDTTRMPGFAAGRSLQIPLTGATIPTDLLLVRVSVEVAGRTVTADYPAAPNLTHSFTWDGTDVFGRTLQGAQEATVTIGYGYRGYYYIPGIYTWEGTVQGASFGMPGVTLYPARTRSLVYRTQSYSTRISGPGPAALNALGGWTVSGLHRYDPDSQALHLGDGTVRRASSVLPGLTSFAGTGAAGTGRGTYSGDGGTATSAGFGDVQGIAVSPDGSVFLADGGNGVIRKIDPAGVISTVAGGGQPATGTGDGGPATQASLGEPVDVAVAPDGSLLIADAAAGEIRQVSPDGIISTVAGGGTPADGLGDFRQATDAQLDGPRGIALGADGTMFIADTGHDRIRRVTPQGVISTVVGGGSPASGVGDGLPGPQSRLDYPSDVIVTAAGVLYVSDVVQNRVRRVGTDGVIDTVAGTGNPGSTGDGGPASVATVSAPTGLAFDEASSTLYVAQWLHHKIRAVDPTGTIWTAAGTGTAGYSGDNGNPAPQARLREPRGLALGSNGALYIADTRNFRIRRLASALPGFSFGDIALPSADGSELYQFDRRGTHLRTRSTLTGQVIATFGYDTAGRLNTISDRFANTTTISWSAAGNPQSITGPFGQSTTLTVDSDGLLDSITNPAGEVVTLDYDAGGLLSSLTNPRGKISTFEYDNLGRLTKDLGPDGHSTTLTRTETPTGVQVAATSAEGRTTTYEVSLSDSGEMQRIVTQPSGARTSTTRRADGTVVGTAPDGTTTTATYNADPRWGLQAPYAAQTITRTPAGKTLTSTTVRSVTLAQNGDPLSMTRQQDSVTANTKTTTLVWDAAIRTFTTTTAGSRSGTTTLNAEGQVSSVQEPGQPVVTFSYDTHGRLNSATATADGQTRSTTYSYGSDGLLASTSDPAGQTVTYSRDAVGRIVGVTQPDVSTLQFGYDPSGNLTSVTPPGRGAHSFTYTAGDLAEQYSPPQVDPQSPAATDYTYNKDRQSQRVAHPDGRTLQLGYDNAGRIATGTIARGTTSFTYDPTTSRLARVDAPDGQYQTFSYDGPLLTVLTTPVGQVGYGYDTDWRATTFTVAGATTALSYNTEGLLTGAGALIITRDSTTGLATGTTLGTITTSHGYSGFAELSQYTASTGAGTLFDTSYTRDPLGRITTKSETLAGTTTAHAYQYDTRGRLSSTSVDGNLTASYNYDSNGNRTSTTTPNGTTSAAYDGQDRILSSGDTTFTHTADGQLATATSPTGTTTYGYDEHGALTDVTLADATTISYTLDAAGRRAAKEVNGTTTDRFLYGTGLQPLAQLDPAGNVVARFVYASYSHVPDYLIKNGTTYRILHDELGSPRLIVNAATGAIAQRLDYDPWGNITTDTNPGFQPFGYAGGLLDQHTKLYRFGARDYHPQLGRWTTRDPIGFAGGDTNLYAYVNNNPVNYIDPTGELLFIPVLLGAWAVAEIGLSIADAISTASTLLDECASGLDKVAAAGLFAFGAFTPGGGYSTARKAADDASGFVGRRGTKKVFDDGSSVKYGGEISIPRGTNPAGEVGGRQYSGHAFDQMQARGITPSVVDDAISNGVNLGGSDGRSIFYSRANNVSVVVSSDGHVVTVGYGRFNP